jgi:hypothetical protein
MKGVTKFFQSITAIAVIIILSAGSTYSQYSVSGTVRFIDNNDPVNAGTVQAYDLSCNLIAQTSINSNGTYRFNSLPSIEMDIIGIPGIGPEDDQFVPGIHPDKTDWQSAVPVYPTSSMAGIDIYVQRTVSPDAPFVSSISGNITLNDKPIANAVVYAKRDNSYYGYGITNSRGDYSINSLPLGDYILVVHRIGASSASLGLTLTMEGLININYNLEEAPPTFNNSVPKLYDLSQNYPNPFNPSTKINYSLPVTGLAKVSVYNSLGQLVKVLVNEIQTAGSYTVTFDGGSLSSGIYYYRLETNGYVDTKKMILVK